jgi:hypothetical protein
MNDVTTSYLQNEVTKAEKRLRITVIAMAIVAVVLIGYFQWIKSLVAEIIEPENVSEFVSNELRRNLPEARTSLQAGLVEAAPDMVHYVMQTVVEQVLPAVTESVSNVVKRYSQEAAIVGGEGVLAAFKSTLQECKAAQLKAKGAPVPSTIADATVACFKDRYDAQLDKGAEAILGGELTASAKALNNLNSQLKGLASRSKLSREDELGKQLVTTWWTFLDRNHPELAAPDL